MIFVSGYLRRTCCTSGTLLFQYYVSFSVHVLLWFYIVSCIFRGLSSPMFQHVLVCSHQRFYIPILRQTIQTHVRHTFLTLFFVSRSHIYSRCTGLRFCYLFYFSLLLFYLVHWKVEHHVRDLITLFTLSHVPVSALR